MEQESNSSITENSTSSQAGNDHLTSSLLEPTAIAKDENEEKQHNLLQLVSEFQYEKLLNSNTQTKTIILLGSIGSKQAIVIIEKSHFIAENLTNGLDKVVEDAEIINSNDIYTWAKTILYQNLKDQPAAKLNLIYPATETHIRKYAGQKVHYIRESPEMYRDYVVPYIETMKGDRLQWVYNILYHGKEAETVVYNDKSPQGFVLLPDMKWDGINMENLYLCCIVNRQDIASIRDLRGEDHLTWLAGIRDKIIDVCKEKYELSVDGLRIFVHYQPSYYHFHIHVVTVQHPGLGDGANIGKAILLDDIIDNLALDPGYYKKKTIGYVLGENHGLWQVEGYREAHHQNQ